MISISYMPIGSKTHLCGLKFLWLCRESHRRKWCKAKSLALKVQTRLSLVTLLEVNKWPTRKLHLMKKQRNLRRLRIKRERILLTKKKERKIDSWSLCKTWKKSSKLRQMEVLPMQRSLLKSRKKWSPRLKLKSRRNSTSKKKPFKSVLPKERRG